MFYVILLLSAFCMLVAYLTLRRSGGLLTAALFLLAMGLAATCLVSRPGIWLCVIVVQSLLLLGVVTVAKARRWTPAYGARLIGLATLAAYSLVGSYVAHDMAELRGLFPYRSMEASLSEPKRHLGEPLPERAAQHLDEVEKARGRWMFSDGTSNQQSQLLEQLHEHTLDFFVNQPGFGVTRMGDAVWTQARRTTWVSVKQPGGRREFAWSTGDFEGPSPMLLDTDYGQTWELHLSAMLNFTYSGNFVYFKDRRHVAGFK
jgi:hypothetical protein